MSEAMEKAAQREATPEILALLEKARALPPLPDQPIPTPFLKRTFDIAFSGTVLTLTLPVFLVTMLAIFLEHLGRGQAGAPLFYYEPRISQGRTFHFMKFFIFKPEVIEELKRQGKFIHTKYLEWDGHSMTKVGSVLQKIYLDELPQLINIFLGDISVVGPRPINLEVYQEALAAGVLNWKVLRAGITGRYQSFKGHGLSRDDQYLLDRDYVELLRTGSGWQVLRGDLQIVVRTIKVMLKAQGL